MMLTGKMFSTPKNGLAQKHDAILLSSCISVLSHIYTYKYYTYTNLHIIYT